MSVSSIPVNTTRIACVQFEPVVGEKQHNIALSLRHLEAAALQGAQLIVMPELCNSGYMFKDRLEAFSMAEEIPTGPTCVAWLKAAHRLGVTIVAGIADLGRINQALFQARGRHRYH